MTQSIAMDVDPVVAERRILIKFILEENARRGVDLQLPVGCDGETIDDWLLDAIDAKKLIHALRTSSKIDLTSVCEAENVRPVVRRMSATSTISERDMIASLAVTDSDQQLPRLILSDTGSRLDDQCLADVAFEFFLDCCGKGVSSEIMQSMRGQLEVSERLASDLEKLMKKLNKKSKSSMILVESHIKLLQLASPPDFQNFRAYMAWRDGTSVLIQESVIHAVNKCWKADSTGDNAHYLLARMRGAFRRLHSTDPDDYDPKEKSEAVDAIASACDQIAANCDGKFEIPWYLRVSIAEVLLRGSFDTFDAGSLIDEADELEHLLARNVWPVLGITDDIRVALQIWAHYRNFYVSKEIGLLERAIEIVSEVDVAGQRNASTGDRTKLVNNILDGIRSECIRVLSDYHHTCRSPREVSTMIRLLVAVDKVSGGKDALADTLSDLIRASVTENFDRKVLEIRQHSPSDQDQIAMLATACLEMLRSECEDYSAMLRHYVPASTGLAASALHEAFGSILLPWIVSIRNLNQHIIATLGTAMSLEDHLLLEMSAFGMDSTEWGVLGRVTPKLYDWTNGQLNTLDQWCERIVASETWKSSSSPTPGCGTSMGEILKASNDAVESLFTMGIPIPPGVVRSLVDGVDSILQKYCDSIIAPLLSVDEIFPPKPPLTRYKKDVVDTAQQIDTPKKSAATEKSPSSLKSITAKVGNVFTSSWLPGLDVKQREQILDLPYESLALRANSLQKIAQGMPQMQDVVIEKWESGQPRSSGGTSLAGSKTSEWASGMFSGVVDKATASIHVVLHFIAVKLVCGHLREDIFSNLYRFSVQNHRINNILLKVDACLGKMCETLFPELTNMLAQCICESLTAAIGQVLLDGGPVRWFSLSDVGDLKEDMESMAYMFYADGEGLRQEDIEEIMRKTLNIVQLMDEDTGALVALLKDKKALTRKGLDQDTVLRVLCHRKDHSASKFLKKEYKIKKTLPNIIGASLSASKSSSLSSPR
jgi:hypothetical protein